MKVIHVKFSLSCVRKIFIIFFTLLFSATVKAQIPLSCHGITIDSSSNLRLNGATVLLLHAKDSTLIKYAYSNKDGEFDFTNLSAGKYIILVTAKKYIDRSLEFTLSQNEKAKDLGYINMFLPSVKLNEVIIRGERRAMTINGDTLQFNANAYFIKPNEVVEDLLRQLPGLQIDKDGKIKFNGKQVAKVLVDGEEFFGDDPTLVTKNIRSDMVDQVQIFDKKSDQATFTGIDDGIRTKTINIKLKDNKRIGSFGKVYGSLGTKKYYENQAFYNLFDQRQKFSVFGTFANDGVTGLNIGDNSSLDGNQQNNTTNEISINPTSIGTDALDSFNGAYDGKGQPTVKNGGVHYDVKSESKRLSVNANVKYGQIDINGTTREINEQIVKGASLNTNVNQTFFNRASRERIDGILNYALNSSSGLKLTLDGVNKTFEVDNTYNSGLSNALNLVNTQDRQISNSGKQQQFKLSALYTKKFGKQRRTLSWQTYGEFNDQNTAGFLRATTSFFSSAQQIDSVQKVSQFKTNDFRSSKIESIITYTEPISKTTSIAFNYNTYLIQNNNNNRTLNESSPGKFENLDSTYSNHYRFNQFIQQIGATTTMNINPINISLGLKASLINFKQVNQSNEMKYGRQFYMLNPLITLMFNPSLEKSITFRYNGSNNQPTIDEIQPVRININPTNISIGNPLLQPSFTHNFYINYSSFKPVAAVNVFFDAGFNFTTSPIINSVSTDIKSGITTSSYINLSGKTASNYYFLFNETRKIKPLKITVGLNIGSNGSVDYSYVNNVINVSKSSTYTSSIQLTKTSRQKYIISVNAGPRYFLNTFSLNEESNSKSWGLSINSRVTYYLPSNFTIKSDLSYLYTGPTQIFDDQKRTVWNASFEKGITKDNGLKVALNINDILNQNINFNRRATGNAFYQSNTNGIRRYIMLSLKWDFSKFPTTDQKSEK